MIALTNESARVVIAATPMLISMMRSLIGFRP